MAALPRLQALILASTLWGAALVPPPLHAAPPLLAVKAALLFKLPRFTYWPERDGPGAPIELCIWGENPFGDALEPLAQTPIDGRGVSLHYPSAVEQAQACSMVFFPHSAAAPLKIEPLLLALSGQSVLTVSDIPGFAQAGGMVELAAHPQDASKLHILINQSAAASQGVKFNAQLLRLATLLP